MVQPDPLDRKIMRELESPVSLQWNVRESLSSVAKKVGVDEETVRRRVEQMRRAGILTGWQLIVNPHLIGRDSASLELDVQNATPKNKVIDQIRLVDGVISILDFQGPSLQVGIYYKNERMLTKQISLMESICGCKHSMFWNVFFPVCKLKMTKTDWVLLEILRNNPRRKLAEIALDAKLSTRTVTRRLNLMVENYTFFLHALIDLKKVGGLAYRMLLYSKDPDKKSKIDESVASKIEENIEWAYTLSDEYSMFALYCENVTQAREISDFISKIDGVSTLRMDIIENQITIHDWIDDEITAKISSN
ncbi:MAG: Lrp/AsnC family transcriptional regulator [Nitrososphaerales archaeon]